MHISYGMLAIEAVVKMTVVKQAPMHSGVETGKHINVAVTDHKRTAAIKREAFAKVVQRVGGGFGREMECAVDNECEFIEQPPLFEQKTRKNVRMRVEKILFTVL